MADIELVIKIPEEEYNRLGFLIEMGMGTVIDEIVANGTPLPEGHGRLIDADELYKSVTIPSVVGFALKDLLDEAPIIIEADKR